MFFGNKISLASCAFCVSAVFSSCDANLEESFKVNSPNRTETLSDTAQIKSLNDQIIEQFNYQFRSSLDYLLDTFGLDITDEQFEEFLTVYGQNLAIEYVKEFNERVDLELFRIQFIRDFKDASGLDAQDLNSIKIEPYSSDDETESDFKPFFVKYFDLLFEKFESHFNKEISSEDKAKLIKTYCESFSEGFKLEFPEEGEDEVDSSATRVLMQKLPSMLKM